MEATLATIQELEQFRGHLFNWYDTRDLRPLDPKYVSSVDSGNLAGHLIVLGNACREAIRVPSIDARFLLAGLKDSISAYERSHGPEREDRAANKFSNTETPHQCCRFDNSAARTRATECSGMGGTVCPSLRDPSRTLDDIAQALQQEEEARRFRSCALGRQPQKACVESHARRPGNSDSRGPVYPQTNRAMRRC